MMKRLLSYSFFSKTLALNHSPRPADALFSSSSYSAAAPLQPHSIADYLVTTCGFSAERAAKTSAKLRGCTSLRQLDSVIGFFKSHGLDTQMGKLLSWYPRCLFLDVEKSLAPRFQALQALGFSSSDIVHLLRSSPIILSTTVETMVAKIQFWQGILGSNDILLKHRKRGHWLLGYSITNRIKPNIDMLGECGLNDQEITMMMRSHPRIIGEKTEHLKALISRVDSLGVNRSSGMFRWTLWVLCVVSPMKFNAQLELFKRLGWSEDEFLAAFRKTPTFLTLSSQSLQKKVEFLVRTVGCDPSYIASHPVLLTLSLEKRIIPRCRILTALKSRGLCGDKLKLTSFFFYSEKRFLNKYVVPHKEKFPELIGLYKASPK